MATLAGLKKELDFMGEIAEIVGIFKGVAISQFRHLQNRRKHFEAFNRHLDGIFGAIDFGKQPHPFVVKNDSLPRSLVMITSDDGFLGEYNSAIINFALNQRRKGDELIVLGDRGSRYLEERGESFIYFPGITEEITHEEASNLKDYLIAQYLGRVTGEVLFIYARFVSFGLHEVSILPLLPCDFLFSREKETTPKPGFWTEERISIEPSVGEVLDYLVRIWLGGKIYDVFWESKLSEWAARIIHMEGSSQKLSGLQQKLSFRYVRLIHEISDKSIREIFASRSLWRK